MASEFEDSEGPSLAVKIAYGVLAACAGIIGLGLAAALLVGVFYFIGLCFRALLWGLGVNA